MQPRKKKIYYGQNLSKIAIFKIHPDKLHQVDAIAEAEAEPRGAIFRRAVDDYLDRYPAA